MKNPDYVSLKNLFVGFFIILSIALLFTTTRNILIFNLNVDVFLNIQVNGDNNTTNN